MMNERNTDTHTDREKERKKLDTVHKMWFFSLFPFVCLIL